MANVCTICDLPAKSRKVGEAMIREGLSVREATDFSNWWLEREWREKPEGEKAPTVTKSSWDRHKQSEHFVVEEKKDLPTDAKFTNVEDIALEMVRRYGSQLEDPNWLPADRDVREWAALMGKLNDIEQRRRDEARLTALMAGAAFKKPPVVDTTARELTAGVTT